MVCPTGKNQTIESFMDIREKHWQSVLPRDKTEKEKVLSQVMDGVRKLWDDEQQYLDAHTSFPVKIYIPDGKTALLSEDEFQKIRQHLVRTADKTGYVVISRSWFLSPSFKSFLWCFLPESWFKPSNIGDKEIDFSRTAEYIRDPVDFDKLHGATKGISYDRLGFVPLQLKGFFKSYTVWMTTAQGEYNVNTQPIIDKFDTLENFRSRAENSGGMASRPSGSSGSSGCPSGTCACSGGGCSSACCR
jgi:hypothetical protein